MATKIRKWIKNILWKLELMKIDAFSDYMGFQCYRLFPPSFYLTHTKEEIEKAEKELREELLKKIEEL